MRRPGLTRGLNLIAHSGFGLVVIEDPLLVGWHVAIDRDRAFGCPCPASVLNARNAARSDSGPRLRLVVEDDHDTIGIGHRALLTQRDHGPDAPDETGRGHQFVHHLLA